TSRAPRSRRMQCPASSRIRRRTRGSTRSAIRVACGSCSDSRFRSSHPAAERYVSRYILASRRVRRPDTRLAFAHTSPTVRLLDLHQPPTEPAPTAIALDPDLDDLQPGPRARQRQVGGEHERPTFVDDFP